MDNLKVYTIAGNPIPLARPRFSGKKIYNSQRNIMNSASLNLAVQHGNDQKLTGPIHLDATFFMATPQSMSTAKQRLLLDKPHIFKPDLDNLIKFVCDICSEVLFDNDCMVSSISCKKVYDSNPRTEFTVRKL